METVIRIDIDEETVVVGDVRYVLEEPTQTPTTVTHISTAWSGVRHFIARDRSRGLLLDVRVWKRAGITVVQVEVMPEAWRHTGEILTVGKFRVQSILNPALTDRELCLPGATRNRDGLLAQLPDPDGKLYDRLVNEALPALVQLAKDTLVVADGKE